MTIVKVSMYIVILIIPMYGVDIEKKTEIEKCELVKNYVHLKSIK